MRQAVAGKRYSGDEDVQMIRSISVGRTFATFNALKELGLISRIPRLAVINAAGSNTLYQLYDQQKLRWNSGRADEAKINAFFAQMDADNRRASTLATAIEINRPVNLMKCLRALEVCDGIVREVSDEAILEAKAQIGAGGFGSAAASGRGALGAWKRAVKSPAAGAAGADGALEGGGGGAGG